MRVFVNVYGIYILITMKSRLSHYNFELYSLMANKYTQDYVTMFLFSIENSSDVVINRTSIFRLYSKIRDIPKLYFFNVC